MTRPAAHRVRPFPDDLADVLDELLADVDDPDVAARAREAARTAWQAAHRHPVKAATNRDTMLARLADLPALLEHAHRTGYPPTSADSAERVRYRAADAAGRVIGYTAGLPAAGACQRCGRALKDPVSVERGIGPDCWRDGARPKAAADVAAELLTPLTRLDHR